MSNEVEIGTAVRTGKRRHLWLPITLSVLTLGVYGLVWYYQVNREVRDFGAVRGDALLAGSRPVRSILAVTLGGLIVIPKLISVVGTVRRVQRMEGLASGGARPAAIPIALFLAAVVLSILSQVHGLALLAVLSLAAFVAALALVQARLNRAWGEANTAMGSCESSAETVQEASIVGSECAGAAVVPIAFTGA